MSVLDLLPHRPPMVVVDEMVDVDVDAGVATCLCSVGLDAPMARNGTVVHMLVVEMLAQSAACLKGYVEILKGMPVRPAYLVRIDDLETPLRPAPGEQVTVVARSVRGLGDYFIYEAEASGQAGRIAGGTLRFIVDPGG